MPLPVDLVTVEAMSWVVSAVGLVLVAVALRDIFHTLWHPSGFGTIARLVFRSVWRGAARLVPSRSRDLAGPVGLLGTVGTWTSLVVGGFALVYWSHMTEGFHFGSSLQPGRSSDVVAALYLSLVTVTTLGFGDILPAHPALRLLTPVQALVGFVLLTAAISWGLQVYPALGRRRVVSTRLAILRSRGSATSMRTGDGRVAARVLDSLTEGVLQVEADLVQYAESYYFAERQPQHALAATLPYALEMAEAGGRSTSADARRAADELREAVQILARRLDSQYLHTGASTPEVLAAYATDHGHAEHLPDS
jgi:hypothetical protein